MWENRCKWHGGMFLRRDVREAVKLLKGMYVKESRRRMREE